MHYTEETMKDLVDGKGEFRPGQNNEALQSQQMKMGEYLAHIGIQPSINEEPAEKPRKSVKEPKEKKKKGDVGKPKKRNIFKRFFNIKKETDAQMKNKKRLSE